MQAKPAAHGQEISAREAWKLFGIMAEFFQATERLIGLPPAVSVFGSARVKPDTPYYRLAEETARLLSDAGFAVIYGRRTGPNGSHQQGRVRGQGGSPSASTSTCRASSPPAATSTSACASSISSRAR